MRCNAQGRPYQPAACRVMASLHRKPTTTLSEDAKPSISTSSWFRVLSLSASAPMARGQGARLVEEVPVQNSDSTTIMYSTGSMETMQSAVYASASGQGRLSECLGARLVEVIPVKSTDPG
eukprot:scaffold217178_cov22-Tisochrysis_lutea.AAC.1